MLEAIPDPERTTTEANIKAQLQEALILTIAAIDPSLDNLFCATKATDAIEDYLALQDNYMPLNTSDIIEWNYLNANNNADTGLF
jgi:hypothetical protein